MTKKILFAVMISVCVISCTKEVTHTEVVANKPSVENKSCFVPGELIIQFDRGTVELVEEQLMKGCVSNTGLQSLDNALAALHATSIRRLYVDGGKWEARHREAGLHQLSLIHISEPTRPY